MPVSHHPGRPRPQKRSKLTKLYAEEKETTLKLVGKFVLNKSLLLKKFDNILEIGGFLVNPQTIKITLLYPHMPHLLRSDGPG